MTTRATAEVSPEVGPAEVDALVRANLCSAQPWRAQTLVGSTDPGELHRFSIRLDRDLETDARALRSSRARLKAGELEAERLRAEIAAARVPPGHLSSPHLRRAVSSPPSVHASSALSASVRELSYAVARQRSLLARRLARCAVRFRMQQLAKAFRKMRQRCCA